MVFYTAHHVRYSGGLGMANHVGAGDGLSATAFDLPRILPTFFRLKKLVAEGLPDELNLNRKSDQKTTPALGQSQKRLNKRI